MSQLASPIRAKRPTFARLVRYCTACVIATSLVAVVVEAVSQATFHVPTGSMAPHLLGEHRVCVCPRCGEAFPVGRHAEDRKGAGDPRLYSKTFCQNCGLFPVPFTTDAETPGDNVIVNKFTYLLRAPARWEVVVFRMFGSFFVKRLLGLPGEEIFVRDGDIYVNGKLCRKTPTEARDLRVPIYHQRHDGALADSGTRWEGGESRDPFVLDGRQSPANLAYRNFDPSSGKCEPIHDEYAYNASVHADSECVHDFHVAFEFDVDSGTGEIEMQLCDGADWVGVRLAVGSRKAVAAFAESIPTGNRQSITASAEPREISAGRHFAELAFVDRRLSLAIDGEPWLETDLPEVGERNRTGVDRPFWLCANGVRIVVDDFRLFRDVHYSQHGTNAVKGKAVRLSDGQYFVLGDNSARSEDSRYWPNAGRVPGSALVGPVSGRSTPNPEARRAIGLTSAR